ncbi:MAG TPA: glutamate synthase subunit beta, partial [Candidatus Paceibacterota bacterium]|nr:glutamate synthase subunit beta [Candidatus Paceibacterota bacterium]
MAQRKRPGALPGNRTTDGAYPKFGGREFLITDRIDSKYLPRDERVLNYDEFVVPEPEETTRNQAGRCMNCGVPFCHTACPVNNYIPDWNELVYRRDWKTACINLHGTNNFPEFTGRVCPAPCEPACVLNVAGDPPVTIKAVECAIVDRGWREGWIGAQPPRHRTSKRVAIVGSGPAALACAQQLARTGHKVHVFEKHPYPGGMLTYGIPVYKMHPRLLVRRLRQMRKEGVVFHCGVHISGENIGNIVKRYHAVVLACGAEQPRDLNVPGRNLGGIHFAMDYLVQQNSRVLRLPYNHAREITAAGKRVVIPGGDGYTASDCVGNAEREGAIGIRSFGISPEPPELVSFDEQLLVWPSAPRELRLTPSHEEARMRPEFSTMIEGFSGKNGRVARVHIVGVDADRRAIVSSRQEVESDFVPIAIGFSGPVYDGMLSTLRIELNEHGNVKANDRDYLTSVD